MNTIVIHYAEQPDEFKKLEIDEQLAVVADIILHFAMKKTDALAANGKSRVDSCLEAQVLYDLEKYWTNVQTNIRRLAELEVTRARRGI